MKKILTLFMCLALVGLYSCSDDDDEGGNGNNGKNIRVTARYEKSDTGAETYPDTGAKVYFFYDLTPTSEYTYELGGNYITPRGDKLPADQSATIGKDGIANVEAKFTNRPVTVIIESAFYSERYSQSHIGKVEGGETVSAVFRPE